MSSGSSFRAHPLHMNNTWNKHLNTEMLIENIELRENADTSDNFRAMEEIPYFVGDKMATKDISST